MQHGHSNHFRSITLRRRILPLIPLCALWLSAAIQLLGVWRLLVSAYALHGGVVRQFSWAALTVRQEAVWLLLPLLLAAAVAWLVAVCGLQARPIPALTKALRTALPLAVLAGGCYNFCVYFAAEPQLMGQNPALYENVSRLVQFWLWRRTQPRTPALSAHIAALTALYHRVPGDEL